MPFRNILDVSINYVFVIHNYEILVVNKITNEENAYQLGIFNWAGNSMAT